jgi:hypothetical protein
MEGICSSVEPAIMVQAVKITGPKDDVAVEGDLLNLSNELTEKVYEFLFSMGVDEGLAHFINAYVEHTRRDSTVKFLHSLRESLGAAGVKKH